MHPTSTLVQTAYQKSVELLRRNLTPNGVMAAGVSSLAERRSYTGIFGRDASICALGMVHSGDPTLIQGARDGLLTLANHQADNGQIPKFVDPATGDADFWYVGCIDATLWWLVAVEHLSRYTADPALTSRLRLNIDKALSWLHGQEHPQFGLLQQNEASDWADIMPRSGFVLYTNALWYRVKTLYGLAHAEPTRLHFNQLFHPFSGPLPELKRLRLLTHYPRTRAAQSALYLSFVNLSRWGDEGDVFGNLLALLFGLADDAATARVLHALEQAKIDLPYPVVALLDPIHTQDPLWRGYMSRHRQNLPHQYHNGGIWPFVGGFWVVVLSMTGERQRAERALEALAAANRLNDWQFNEWLHGKTGEPSGMAGQSWNAATYILAYHALQHGVL
ncbi:MAG: glycoside hydrolase 100 family protein [Thiohalobacteraceae bacterium]